MARMAHTQTLTAAAPAPLADEAQTSEIGPGLVAFTIVALLGVATFFLIRSMLFHIRKVPPTFETQDTPDQAGGDTIDTVDTVDNGAEPSGPGLS